MSLSRTLSLPRLGAAALPVLLLLGGCSGSSVVMHPAGDVAMQQRNLIIISTLLMLLIIVPVIVCTLLFAWRYRASAKESVYDPEFDHSTALELLIWSAPLLIIICLGALTWGSTHLLDPYRRIDRLGPGQRIAGNVKPLEVQAVALDWKWLFIYPEQGIATVNQLALPVNRPVHFRISASSIMNTFDVPAMAGMIYAMPGMETSLYAVMNKTGTFGGFSGNYSGAGFSDMNFKVASLPPEQFDRWVASAKAGAGRLDRATYMRLEQPSEKVPPMQFASTEPQLFEAVVNECVEPGRPCMSAVMMKDSAARGGSNEHVVNDSAAPPHGMQPEGGLMKQPSEKGAPPNMTVPRKPGIPGNLQPGSQKNRDLSMNDAPAGTARA